MESTTDLTNRLFCSSVPLSLYPSIPLFLCGYVVLCSPVWWYGYSYGRLEARHTDARLALRLLAQELAAQNQELAHLRAQSKEHLGLAQVQSGPQTTHAISLFSHIGPLFLICGPNLPTYLTAQEKDEVHERTLMQIKSLRQSAKAGTNSLPNSTSPSADMTPTTRPSLSMGVSLGSFGALSPWAPGRRAPLHRLHPPHRLP